MTLGSLLTIAGLCFDIWGVLWVFSEWRLAALPEQVKAHLETIQFFRNLRGRFDEADQAYHRKTVLEREIALSRIMEEAHETSFRQDNRDQIMRKGKILILTGFVLQFTGALPLAAVPWQQDTILLLDFLRSEPGNILSASLCASLIISLPLISDSIQAARKTRAFDGTFTGVWWSPFNSEDTLLRMNILCQKSKITGVINAHEVDEAGPPIVGGEPKYYEVSGTVENGTAKIQIQEFVGTAPYPYAVAELVPEKSKLMWRLDPQHCNYITSLPEQQSLERLNTY